MNRSIPPYVRAFLELMRSNKLPLDAWHDVEVLHEDRCPILNGRGPCTCNFDLVVRLMPDDDELAVVKAMALMGFKKPDEPTR
jgi:hypothetical protein